jgi:hypothetical protein
MNSKKPIDFEEERQSLTVFLLEHPTERFHASDLKKHRSVPKHRVRKLLTGQPEVAILKENRRYFYQAAAKKL